MVLKNYKFVLPVISVLFIFNFRIINAKCLRNNCIDNEAKPATITKSNLSEISYLRNKSSSEKSLLEILKIDKVFLDQIFANLVKEDLSNKSKEKPNLEFDILSDRQYEIENTFYAEGNVAVLLNNGTLQADIISYNREKLIFTAKGNLIFKKGSQFFTADIIEYNFQKNTGYIENIYGVLDFLTLDDDFEYKSLSFKDNKKTIDNLEVLNLPSEVQLSETTNLKIEFDSEKINFNNLLGFNSLDLDFNTITKWRFKSEKIDLGLNTFKSELIFFTNDPFNKPQLIVKSKNFVGDINKEKLSSKNTTLILDDFFKIPLGKRTIDNDVSTAIWGFGYNDENLDGLYISRSPISIISKDNFSFNLRPYFLLQRAFQNETDAFREKDKPFYSENIKIEPESLDNLALKTNLRYGLNDWKLNINSYLRSLNPDRLYDSQSHDAILIKSLYQKENSKKSFYVKTKKLNNINDDLYPNQSNLTKSLYQGADLNQSLNKGNINQEYLDDNIYSKLNSYLGFYALYDRDKIHTAYGSKLINDYRLYRRNLQKHYSLIFDLGEYSAKSLNNNNELNFVRYGLVSSFQHIYKIVDLNPDDYIFNSSFKYNPALINQGIFLDFKLAIGLYLYGNDESQNSFSFSSGPRIEYGNFKEKIFDYTSISVITELITKGGESPFEFDNFNENSRIIFDFKQQLLGPLIAGYQSWLNINNKSSNYAKFESIYSLGIKRRAYELNLAFRPEDEAVLFNFNLFNFVYKNNSPKF